VAHADWKSAIQQTGSLRYGGRGFTLIELMIVIAIMLIVMTMSVPLVYKMWHKEALNKAVRDVVEVCSNARAQAILKGTMTEVVFHPADRRLEVSAPAAPAPKPSPSEPWTPIEVVTQPAPPPPPNSGLSAQLSEKITIQMLDVNLTPYKDADVARVRFYPNGTCDELNLVLLSDNGVQVGIDLEVTTGLANVVHDINEWLRR
jgi:prepilin-type N-terminal cleavage/methylation domain-containing protein